MAKAKVKAGLIKKVMDSGLLSLTFTVREVILLALLVMGINAESIDVLMKVLQSAVL
jgi:hypothetical protein